MSIAGWQTKGRISREELLVVSWGPYVWGFCAALLLERFGSSLMDPGGRFFLFSRIALPPFKQALRLVALLYAFFVGPLWRWNVFDIVVVLFTFAELVG